MASEAPVGTIAPEPALRPRGAHAAAVDVVRHARVYGRTVSEDRELVVRDRALREKRYRVGQGGIHRAVYVPGPESGPKASAARWGVVNLEDASGRVILQVAPADWLPEAGLVGLADLSPRQCLTRTGLPALLADLRIPLAEGPVSSQAADSGRYDRVALRELPAWHAWVRGVGMLGWFLLFLVVPMTGHGNRWTVLASAAALLLVPGGDLAARFGLWKRRRRSAPRDVETVIRPSPQPGAGATRRFLGTAAVRVLPSDVSLTSTAGEERRLPRSQAHGATRLTRIVDPSTGATLGVEFRDDTDAARAHLPWHWWFAGPEGAENWSRLVTALGVPVVEESLRGLSADQWRDTHTMSTDARLMAPLTGKEARRRTNWSVRVVGGGEAIVVPVLALMPLLGLGSDQSPARWAGVLAALTIVAELAPVLGHQLASRFTLDRPAGQELR
ncbi:hypothetical protein [Streptomyces sp. NPDC005017]|uniref:hypothetical protein n=1 Tax=Streptomyces sp. NPDC005017 TaxID=3364706 RepID=UPI0036B556E5